MGAKRSVAGRSRPYDELYLDWQREHIPNFVEPVKRETKKEKKEYELETFRTAKYIIHHFSEALESGGWREDDAGEDHFEFEQAYHTRKHTRDIDEYEDEEPAVLVARSLAGPVDEPSRKKQKMGSGDTRASGRATSARTTLT